MQDFPRRPPAAPTDPRGQQAESQAADSTCSVRACDVAAKHLAAMTDTVLGIHPQQPSQQIAEPSQNACSCAEGGAQAAMSADRATECLTPEAAEMGLLPHSAPPSSPLPEPAQEAPAATTGQQDMLLRPVSPAAGHTAAPQQLPRPTTASGAVHSVSAAAGAGQPGAQQQLGEPLAHSLQPDLQSPWPQPGARGAEARTGPPSSCVPAAVPGDELRPEDECLVCWDAQRCVVMAPCGHKPYCIRCAEEVCGPRGSQAKGHICPVCRDPVDATVFKIFN